MNRDDVGKLILRVTLGGLLLLHGIAKVRHWGQSVDFLGEALDGRGLPSFIAYGVFIGELVAPALILLGLFTRPAAVAVVIDFIFVLWLPQRDSLFGLNRGGGLGIELESFYLLSALAIAFLGAGKYSVRGGKPAVD